MSILEQKSFISSIHPFENLTANELDDFFAKRPTAYTKHDKPITKNDLF